MAYAPPTTTRSAHLTESIGLATVSTQHLLEALEREMYGDVEGLRLGT